ncbi:MAG: uracil-DNA glycosylase [Desulfosarcina sp.]|nr:uracil-DNA glycosylase [Desulfobacterales bacterium]
MTDGPIEVLDEILHTLKQHRDDGLTGYDCSDQAVAQMAPWNQPLTRGSGTLDAIRAELGDCRRCRLCDRRRHIVFGAGHPEARLVFVGEGPGRDEDIRGEPFVGAAGELLTRIIQAIKLTRDKVYIANIVKCRPPGNRNPEPEEIKTCLPFLERQLKAINPRFIVALGAVAAQTLLNRRAPISKLRGRFHDYAGIRLLPTYHPAYLLRNPDRKRDVWEDMQMLMKVYDDDV